MARISLAGQPAAHPARGVRRTRAPGVEPNRRTRLTGPVELKRAADGDDVDAFQASLPPGQQAMVAALRRALRAAAPALRETVAWGVPVYRGRANVAAVLAYDEEVHLAFFEGARLTVDPGMLKRTGITEALYLLQGVGDRIRFLRLRTAGEIDPETVAELVRQAVQLDRAAPASG